MADLPLIEPGFAADSIRKTEHTVMAALGCDRLPDFVRRAVLLSVVGDSTDRENALALVKAITQPIDNRPQAQNATEAYDRFGPDKAAFR